jgi:signal transduction histidine kinase
VQGWTVTFRKHLRSAVAASCLLPVLASEAAAQSFSPQAFVPQILLQYGGVAGVTLGFALCFAIYKISRLTRSERAARHRVAELEVLLNESESAAKSEAHLLLTWRGNQDTPDRLSGLLHGTVDIPNTLTEIMDFAAWLEPDSIAMLTAGLKELREQGMPFNIGIRTKAGDLIEADGRVAGSLAALKFRPLSGERRQVSELAYDASKLVKQVERLSGLLDAAPFPIWIRDHEGKLQWVNQAYVKETEAGDISAVLTSNLELVKPEQIDPQTSRAHTVLRGNMRALEIREAEFEIGRAGFALDVSDIENAQKELERHIKAHASTLDKLDTAIAIFGPDQRLRFYNNAYCSLWGLDTAWLKTHPLDGELIDHLRARRAIPEQVNFREWKAKQLSSYQTLETREDYWYLPDGRSLRVICEQHPFGGVTYLYENLTKEIQLESRYNELIGVQRETLDNLAEAVSLFGSDGKLRLFNPAFVRFSGVDASLLSTQPHIDDLARYQTHDSDAEAAWQNIRLAVTNLDSNRKTVEGRFLQEKRTLRYRGVPLPDGNCLLTLTDVSDASRAEQALRDRTEALEAADKLKNSFLANVSYQIRTPLTSIVGFSEALEFGLAGPLTDKQQSYVKDIRNSSLDLKAIIDAIIDLSTVDAGAMELKVQPVDVVGILESVVEKHADQLEKRQLGLTVEVGSDVTEIIADPVRLDQIIGNLLSNAIGFSPPGSTIQIGARKKDAFVQLWVADSGRGIEPEYQTKVFERFQSRPLPGSHRGPGLGLAIVKSFTELHGGKVSLISKIDQGTTVVCTLPINGPRKGAVDSRNLGKASQAA